MGELTDHEVTSMIVDMMCDGLEMRMWTSAIYECSLTLIERPWSNMKLGDMSSTPVWECSFTDSISMKI